MNVADRAEIDPNELFRSYCAVSYDFGVADIVIRARVKMTLRAFTGRAVPVFDKASGHNEAWAGVSGTKYPGQAWIGSNIVTQLFIPGLREETTKFPTRMCHDALQIVEKVPLDAYNRKKRRQEELLRKHV